MEGCGQWWQPQEGPYGAPSYWEGLLQVPELPLAFCAAYQPHRAPRHADPFLALLTHAVPFLHVGWGLGPSPLEDLPERQQVMGGSWGEGGLLLAAGPRPQHRCNVMEWLYLGGTATGWS